MQLDDITIEVRRPDLTREGQIPMRYVTDLQLVKSFNSVGSWSLHLPVELLIAQKLVLPGYGIIVTGPGDKILMSGPTLSATHDQTTDDPQGTWMIQGADDNLYLADALAFPVPGQPDVTLQVDSHDVRTGAAEDVIRGYFSDNVGPTSPVGRRPATSLGLGTYHGGIGGTVTGSARFDQLGLILSQVASVGGLGFDMQQNGSTVLLETYAPVDRSRTVRMDIDNDQLTEASYGYGAPTGTRVIVAGQGQEEDRTFIQVTSTESTAAEALWHRKIEVFKDRRDTDDPVVLLQEGVDDLSTGGTTVVSLQVKPADVTTMVYGVDWYLGDVVAVTVDQQDVVDVVTGAIIRIGPGGVQVGAVVGDPTGFDYESQLVAAQQSQEERLAFLEKNAELGVTTNSGVVASTWSSGPAPVTLDRPLSDGTTVVSASLPANDTTLQPGSPVTLQKIGAAWVITGAYAARPAFMKQLPVALKNGWILYSDAITSDIYGNFGDAGSPGDASVNSTSTTAGKIHVTKTSTGIVSVTGLVRRATAPAAATVIATLPVGFRPRQTFYFSNYSGSGIGNGAVLPTGDIIFLGAVSNNTGFYSLDNIRFREVGAPYTFVPLTLSTNWAACITPVFGGDTTGVGSHTPGYTMDEEGVVLFEGVAQATAAQSAGAAISTVSGLASLMTVHNLVYGYGVGYNYVRYGGGAGSGIGNVLNMGLAIASASVITLSQIVLVMPSSQSGVTQPLTWYDMLTTNSWVAYNTSLFAKPAVTKTRDGLVLSGGLLISGTIGSTLGVVPAGWKPRYQALRGTISNTAIARFDAGPPGSPGTVASGTLVPSVGSNAWYSLDGLSWPAYR